MFRRNRLPLLAFAALLLTCSAIVVADVRSNAFGGHLEAALARVLPGDHLLDDADEAPPSMVASPEPARVDPPRDRSRAHQRRDDGRAAGPSGRPTGEAGSSAGIRSLPTVPTTASAPAAQAQPDRGHRAVAGGGRGGERSPGHGTGDQAQGGGTSHGAGHESDTSPHPATGHPEQDGAADSHPGRGRGHEQHGNGQGRGHDKHHDKHHDDAHHDDEDDHPGKGRGHGRD